jgi:hypothetical protein
MATQPGRPIFCQPKWYGNSRHISFGSGNNSELPYQTGVQVRTFFPLTFHDNWYPPLLVGTNFRLTSHHCTSFPLDRDTNATPRSSTKMPHRIVTPTEPAFEIRKGDHFY